MSCSLDAEIEEPDFHRIDPSVEDSKTSFPKWQVQLTVCLEALGIKFWRF